MEIKFIKPVKHKFFNKLIETFNPPKEISFLGQLPEGDAPIVSIVGSRKPTAYGREVAHQLSYDLTKKGAIIVSGLALGIDAIAHKACLDAGGTTVAVLGGGLNYITPRNNQALARRIIESGGAIVSEYPPEHPALPHQFLERNRIVSGLADAIIVVEAAKRSGTLSTAAHALSQNHELFAVPGPISNPMSTGCNNLIKQGAHLVTSADDVWETLGFTRINSRKQPSLPILTNETEAKIVQIIASGINDGDQILSNLKISPDEFNFHLTMLEINGHIVPLGANRWRLQ